VIDMTERTRAEADLRTITDTIRQPIGVEARDGTQLYANRVALDNSGLTLDEVIKEGFFARLCHPDDINRTLDKRRIGLLEGIPMIGVLPEAQGKGLASGLMNPMIQRMKEESIPLFLETANPRNVDIYKKKGFKIFETLSIGDHNLVLMSTES
jgi:GNAT superfamily N-acetyltransferase